jgi:amidase
MGNDASELSGLDATDQAELVRSGQASPSELVEAAIATIVALNGEVNAVIHQRFERAREEAAGPLPAGPFRGVPIVVKDLSLRMAGEPYHCGSRFLKAADHRSDHDSYLTRRFRATGVVVVGRTNTPEFGSTVTTEPLAYGATRNPWNLARSTGGSSGGSAAAVACGMVPLAHATDGGGSIRVPASECGLVGLKPSRGRVTHGPDLGEGWMGATTDGVLSRSVRDTAAALDGISGYEPGDPYTAPPPLRPFVAELAAEPGELRIGLLDHPLADGVTGHPECRAAVVEAGNLLEALGHRVELDHPVALEEPEFSERFVTIVAVTTAHDLDRWEAVIGRAPTDEDVERGNLALRGMGRKVSGAGYLDAVNWLHAWSRRAQAWWAEGAFDVLVTPTLAVPPPELGYLSDPELGGRRLREVLQYTSQFNITGQPAISLPLHWTADGLPVGVQFVARYGAEDVLLRLAAQLERAQPWAGRRPPVRG